METLPNGNDLLNLLQDEKVRRECESSLTKFVRHAWKVIEPGVPYIHGWHIDVICEHLQAITEGHIRNLLINIPPRCAKSTIVAVLWPSWEWIRSPHEKYLCASYSGILSTRDSIKSRRLISSPWYQKHWGHVFKLTADQNQKTRYENNATGYRIASSVGGTATGEGGSRLVLDDPHGAQEAQSDTMRETALEWFNSVWSTRLNNPKKDAMVTIMQRLHEKDISGRIIEMGDWEHVCLPAEYDAPNPRRSTSIGNYDKRTATGELLWPERFGTVELDKIKASLGVYGVSGQLQQSPTPAGGGLFKTAWFRLWPHGTPLPVIEYIIQSYDTAFTEKTDNDPTACTVWGVFTHKNTKCALMLDCWDEYYQYPELRKQVLSDWNAEYAGDLQNNPQNIPRKANLVLIENKGSGISLIQDLRTAKVPVHAYNPGKADKVSRAHVVSPLIEIGLVWLLESKKEGKCVSWADPFMAQVTRFPKAENDDYVDTLTQALRYLRDADFLGLPQTRREEPEEPKRQIKRVNPYAL